MLYITGFPGFLASEFMLRRIKKDSTTQFICLVQKKFLPLAEDQMKKFGSAHISLIAGDITLENLGLNHQSVQGKIDEIFHFAAVYDLNVGEELAKKINVLGTENVLKFAASRPELKRFHYISTCYVSGSHLGVFKETDLELGQSFNNFYESTKFEAEKKVRAAMAEGLKATIYRPAVVVGNSKTGVTQKYDGPYFILQWLLRQGRIAVLPRLFYPKRFTLNVVPSDFVLDAMSFLSTHPLSEGKTYQLADTHPLSIDQMIKTLGKAANRKVITIPLPKSIAKWAVKHIPGLEPWLGIPHSALDYFAHPTRYSTEQTLIGLAGSEIRCPAFPEYASTLTAYMKAHPDLRTKPLI